jgi:hypothetical protein
VEKNCCNLIGPCNQTTKCRPHISHLVGLWSAVSNAISSKHDINILVTTRGSEFPIAIPSFFGLSEFILKLEVCSC